MHKLFVSYNCGISYHEEAEAENLEELLSQTDKLDEKMLRYYVEKDGKMLLRPMCQIHAQTIEGFVKLLL